MPTAERAPSPSFLGALMPTGRKKCRPGTRGGQEGEAGPPAPAAATPPTPTPPVLQNAPGAGLSAGVLRRPWLAQLPLSGRAPCSWLPRPSASRR